MWENPHDERWIFSTKMMPIAIHLGRWRNPGEKWDEWTAMIADERYFFHKAWTAEQAKACCIDILRKIMQDELNALPA